jgi:uncharacterized protein YaiL (DUF2058 family)
MSKSLHEQLLKAGLVDKKKADQVAREKKNKQKKGPKKKKADKGKLDASKAAAMQAAQEKVARDRQLNEAREQEQAAKAVAAQVKQLIETHRCQKQAGVTPYRFKDNNKIHTLMLTDALVKDLFSKKLVVVRWRGGFELLPADAAEKVAARDSALVISAAEPDKPDEDDPYADFQIPDDLVW